MGFWTALIFLASWLVFAVALGVLFGRAAHIGDEQGAEALAARNSRPHGSVEVL